MVTVPKVGTSAAPLVVPVYVNVLSVYPDLVAFIVRTTDVPAPDGVIPVTVTVPFPARVAEPGGALTVYV